MYIKSSIYTVNWLKINKHHKELLLYLEPKLKNNKFIYKSQSGNDLRGNVRTVTVTYFIRKNMTSANITVSLTIQLLFREEVTCFIDNMKKTSIERPTGRKSRNEYQFQFSSVAPTVSTL